MFHHLTTTFKKNTYDFAEIGHSHHSILNHRFHDNS